MVSVKCSRLQHYGNIVTKVSVNITKLITVYLWCIYRLNPEKSPKWHVELGCFISAQVQRFRVLFKSKSVNISNTTTQKQHEQNLVSQLCVAPGISGRLFSRGYVFNQLTVKIDGASCFVKGSKISEAWKSLKAECIFTVNNELFVPLGDSRRGTVSVAGTFVRFLIWHE